MDVDFKTYLDERFRELNKRLDAMAEANGEQRREAAERSERTNKSLNRLEVRVGVVENSRPTYKEMIASAVSVLLLALALATVLAEWLVG